MLRIRKLPRSIWPDQMLAKDLNIEFGGKSFRCIESGRTELRFDAPRPLPGVGGILVTHLGETIGDGFIFDGTSE